jgi:hypothetical protein
MKAFDHITATAFASAVASSINSRVNRFASLKMDDSKVKIINLRIKFGHDHLH